MRALIVLLFTSVIAGFLMLVVFGKPISWLMTQLTDGLNSMSGANAVLGKPFDLDELIVLVDELTGKGR